MALLERCAERTHLKHAAVLHVNKVTWSKKNFLEAVPLVVWQEYQQFYEVEDSMSAKQFTLLPICSFNARNVTVDAYYVYHLLKVECKDMTTLEECRNKPVKWWNVALYRTCIWKCGWFQICAKSSSSVGCVCYGRYANNQ